MNIEITDSKGNELAIGDRVYIPGVSWNYKSSMVSTKIFSDAGEEILRPGVRGRIIDVGFSKKWDSPYIEVRDDAGGHNRFSWPELARKQAGRSRREKEAAKFADINEGRKAVEKDAKASARVRRKGL